jgi:predicted Abi (CAAX) family protease
VVQQKKRLHRNVGKELVLQNQLHVVEQEAAQLVAQMVSDNPPKALMAIISPQGLGAWSGDKPQKPGGGAPCPSDFLLRKEARRDKGNRQQSDNLQKQPGEST